jgi:hypothetical protein
MLVRKYCLCGVKLERDVSDEETARKVVARFRIEHGGEGHGVASKREYEQAVSSIIRANSNKKERPSGGMPLRTFRVIRGGRG